MKLKLMSVFVDDQDKALKFYTDILGFVKKLDFPMGKFKWLTVVSPEEQDGTQLLLEPNHNPAAKTYQTSDLSARDTRGVILCHGHPDGIPKTQETRRDPVRHPWASGPLSAWRLSVSPDLYAAPDLTACGLGILASLRRGWLGLLLDFRHQALRRRPRAPRTSAQSLALSNRDQGPTSVSIRTFPASSFVLQVPHCPCRQDEGIPLHAPRPPPTRSGRCGQHMPCLTERTRPPHPSEPGLACETPASAPTPKPAEHSSGRSFRNFPA